MLRSRCAVCLLLLAAWGAAEPAAQESPPPPGNADQPVVGVFAADCRTCHPQEAAAWMHSAHYRTDELLFEDSARDYAQALGIPADRLRHDALCVRCHATVLPRPDAQPRAVYGVSCESCHGGAGGPDGWLNRHHTYGPFSGGARHAETALHKAQRHDHCTQAGMVRGDDLYAMARQCYDCHLVDNARLVRAGHSVGSYEFEFTSWSAGEIRHNFFLQPHVNQPAPSLWLEANPGRTHNRLRKKYAVGVFVELESALSRLAQPLDSADEYYVSEMLNRVRACLNRMQGWNVDQARQAVELARPLLSTSPVNDGTPFAEAARKVGSLARDLAADRHGNGLEAVDAALRTLEPVGTPFNPAATHRPNPIPR